MHPHIRAGRHHVLLRTSLPQHTLTSLRTSWTTPRHPVWLLPAPGRGRTAMTTASTPMPSTSVQDAFRAALRDSGIHTRASVHTLRHSWATPLREAGVNL